MYDAERVNIYKIIHLFGGVLVILTFLVYFQICDDSNLFCSLAFNLYKLGPILLSINHSRNQVCIVDKSYSPDARL
jgi:hypothetical protein